ncbi:hypothetical protein [Dactylosporangium sp. NPDC005555]|uniref:hypothetical protein n=1 Tax=Dactylosporangium sp. NPDC005555 TaxID=3154889 RepID=UPI0033A64CA1
MTTGKARLRVVYLEFGAARPALAWHDGRSLDPGRTGERARIHQLFNQIVDRAAADTSGPHGRAVRHAETLLVEVPVGDRLLVTIVVSAVGGSDWPTRCATQAAEILRAGDLDVEPATLSEALADGWRTTRPFRRVAALRSRLGGWLRRLFRAVAPARGHR